MNSALRVVKGGVSNHAQSSLGLHMGEALCRIASTYPTILDVILEQVQNAIDANAKSISVVLNRKTRHVAIRDDGDGVSVSSLDSALQKICRTQKQQDKLGRFGIGLISPLDKCHSFTFTSCPKGSKEYTEWKFVTEEIREQDKNIDLVRKSRPDIFFLADKSKSGPKGKTSVMWKTEVNIYKYSDDKTISRITSIDSLAESILERFGHAMRRNKVVLNLKFVNENGENEVREGIRAKQFTGRPLAEVTLQNDDAGKVTFRLFMAVKTTKGQLGKVSVGEQSNDYRFPFNLMARAAEGLLSDEARQALLSGFFEGEIFAEKVELHATRKAFKKDDAFVGMCIAIDTWFETYGIQHLEKVKGENRDERYQELGLRSLREIEEMFNLPAFEVYRSVIASFKLGTVGQGHTPRQNKAVVGKQDEPALSTKGTHGVQSNQGDGSGGSQIADSDIPEHLPFTVAGPRGTKRTLVRNSDSAGLQISHIPMDGSSRLWELDSRQGILHFNINHPIWVACDVSDRKIMQLQETVAINALMLEVVPDELKDAVRYVFDESLPSMIHLFHKSFAFNPQIRPKSKKG